MPSVGPAQYAARAAFGNQVRAIRRLRGLSQEELAHVAGLDRSYVGGVERGERNVALDNIHRLANALEVDPAEFFTGEAR